jgi:DNA-repair protein XRCC2
LPAPILPIPSGISLEEAKYQERMYRRKVVEKGEIVGLVRTPGSTNVGRFLLQIGANDVTSSEQEVPVMSIRSVGAFDTPL